MKKLTIKLSDDELKMLEEVTNIVLDVKSITDKEMDEAIRSLITIFYLNEVVPKKYGNDAVIKIENEKGNR